MAITMSSNDHSEITSGAIIPENAWNRFMTIIGWYPKRMTSEEKLLLLKLDLSILIFGCLSFFTKYLDQQSITNAYVSGMKEDLGLYGDELNYIIIIFWASYCTFMIPACYLLTHHRANLVLPALEIGWGLSTFGLAWAGNVQTLYAMRFFTGLFECCSFTGTIYVIGSWYKPDEVGRRVALFFIASPLGTMFAGYLQAAAYTNLHQVSGLAGWRWLFIVDAVITLPIALLWHWYAFVFQWSIIDQNSIPGTQPFSLYLKAKSDIYPVVQINTIPTITTAITIVAAITSGVTADRTGCFWIPSILATIPVLVGIALLVAWDVGECGRLVGFILNGFEGALPPLTMGWATVIMAGDAEARAVVTASMNAVGQAIMAGTQVVQYPATGAPNFHPGFSGALATTVIQLLTILLILLLSQRDTRRDKDRYLPEVDAIARSHSKDTVVV